MTTRRDENNVWVSVGRGENVYKETTKTPVSDKQAYEECEHKKRERDKEGCRLKSNGCNEDGWDLFEQQTREEFEYYAVRRGYDITRDSEYSFFYADKRTADAWEMYHHGHVKGRVWNETNNP